jgi:hypothetical protein
LPGPIEADASPAAAPATGLRLPNFFIIGCTKGGTTSLHYYLAQHPAVFMSAVKEPHFFSLRPGERHHEGPTAKARVSTWEDYLELFRDAGDARVRGESSTGYLVSPEAPGAVRARIPEARMVAVLRHPVDRIVSHWKMFRRLEVEPLELEAALAAEEQRLASGWPPEFGYQALSRYGEGLRRWYELFPAEQIRVFHYEALDRDPAAVVREVCTFLGVDPDVPLKTSWRYNAAPPEERRSWLQRLQPRRPDLTPGLRRKLLERYRDDLALVDRLTGGGFSAWLEE